MESLVRWEMVVEHLGLGGLNGVPDLRGGFLVLVGLWWKRFLVCQIASRYGRF